jgi:hypothetical protein
MNNMDKVALEEILEDHYHLPFLEACIMLRIDTAELRLCMKKCGLTRWPFNYKRSLGIALEPTQTTHLFNNFKVEQAFPEFYVHDTNPKKKTKMDDRPLESNDFNTRIQIKNLLN